MRFLYAIFVAIMFYCNPVFCQVTFLEMAADLNMAELDFSSGIAIVDIDNDYSNEVIAVNCMDQNRFYIRNGSTFSNTAQFYEISFTNDFHDISMVDINFDYLPDFFLTGCNDSGCDSRFYVNQFPEPFVELSGLYNLDVVTDMSATFFQMTPSSGICVLAGRSLKVLQYGTFIDVTQGSGLEGLSNVFCPVFFDIDGDIDDDLFIAGNWELNSGTLFRNNGDGTFSDISNNTNEGGFGYGQEVTYGDIDNDGDFDIYLCSGYGTNSMWQNDGTGYFVNITDLSNTGCGGYSRGANFADFDNDSDIDLFVNRASDRKMLYLNNGDGIFTDFSEEAGVVHYAGGFGCAIGDLNNNGQIDIIAANSDYVSKQVYINQNLNPSFLKVKVVGRPPNTLALGAIVELYGTDSPQSDRTFIAKREISSHPSLYCVNDPIVHFGTGDFTELEVIIFFQSLAVKDTFGVSPGQTIILEEPIRTSVENQEPILPPDQIVLSAYPNPFNSSTMISIAAENSENYILAIYDMLGRCVKSETIANNSSGKSTYIWDGADSDNNPLPSGVYFVRVNNKRFSSELKITMVK
ncbi:MAG: T9SS type A sorting domain-containing protein [candidate division Zixibacteria bacterium]